MRATQNQAGQNGLNLENINVDKEGYLRNLDDWTESAAQNLAAGEGISLTPAHWEVINLLRKFHRRYQMSPASRALISHMKKELGAEKGRSVYVMKLFGGSAAKTAAKIAGLPKPDNCI